METIKFDPRDFISAPYIKCPKCDKESFGILMVCGNHYCRRCRECLYPKGNEPGAKYTLPKLNKKIIYIDQFALSNMMKALNPETKAYQKGKTDDFWVKLFKRLDSLCKLQLIICPESSSHEKESLVSSYFAPLKQMYEMLSNGISFYDHETIKNFQICEHAKNWITGNQNKELNLNVHSIVYGKINSWQERLLITINMNYDEEWIDNLRKNRENVHKGLSECFKYWQSEKEKPFNYWVEEESRAFGKAIIQGYNNYLQRFMNIKLGLKDSDAEGLLPTSSVSIIHSIQDVFENAGVKDIDIWQKTIEYLTTADFKNVPFIKISAMLYAALARQAANNRKELPSQGMFNDIQFISALLPYCDVYR